MGYTLATIKALVQKELRHIVHWDKNENLLYQIKTTNIHYYSRSEINYESLRKLVENKPDILLFQVGKIGYI